MAESSFRWIFWISFISYIPGGFLAAIVPPHKVFGFAICFSLLLNMTIPSSSNFLFVIMVRAIQGILEVIVDL